ncbi:MAG: hypothetical protein AAF660_01600, partial [Pseudomonadota bacterium]
DVESPEGWRVEIRGHQFDIEDFVEVIVPDGFSVKQDEDEIWFISGQQISTADSAQDARDVTDEVLSRVNATLSIRSGKYKPITMGALARCGDQQSVTIEAQSVEMRFKVRGALINAGDTDDPPPVPREREREWMRVAEKDSEVLAVFKLMNSDRDNKFYRVFERIRDDVGGEASIRDMSEWSKPKYSAMKATLNAPRHENPDEGPRLEPAEAEAMIRDLLGKWLDEKARNLE